MVVKLEFKKEDCWIGVFWRTEIGNEKISISVVPYYKRAEIEQGLISLRPCKRTDVWICLIPCFPIHITHFNEPKVCGNCTFASDGCCMNGAGEIGTYFTCRKWKHAV